MTYLLLNDLVMAYYIINQLSVVSKHTYRHTQELHIWPVIYIYNMLRQK